MNKITLDQFMAFGPCSSYPRSRISDLFAGRDACTARDMRDWDIPAIDRIWAVTRPGVTPIPLLVKWSFGLAKRAVQRSLDSGFGVDCPVWLAWATEFVMLTEIPAAADAADAAADAARAADSAARAADSAARAADSAADSAADAAYAADAAAYAADAARAADSAAYAAAYAARAAAYAAAEQEQQILDLIALLESA